MDRLLFIMKMVFLIEILKPSYLWPIIAESDAHLKHDALERRSVIAVNNQVPGPTIITQKGQTLNIKVVNNLASESISIHWHGQHVKDAPWMDGVVHVTRAVSHCAIYIFHLQV